MKGWKGRETAAVRVSERGLMDVERLEFLLRIGGEALVRDVLGIFLDQGSARIQAIRESIHHGDSKALEAAAHALRSSAIQVGFSGTGQICLELEKSAEKHEISSSRSRVDELQLEFEKDRAAYLAWSAGLPGSSQPREIHE